MVTPKGWVGLPFVGCRETKPFFNFWPKNKDIKQMKTAVKYIGFLNKIFLYSEIGKDSSFRTMFPKVLSIMSNMTFFMEIKHL